MTQNHTLVITTNDAVPTQVFKGRKMPCLELSSTHEEADILITQHAIHIAKENTEPIICVVCDDTDVFALLLHFYSQEKLQCSLTMQSPIHGRPSINIKETALKQAKIIPEILALHALSGCDSVAATYGIGKTKAITAAQKGQTLDQLGHPTADMAKVITQATLFMGTCYGVTTPSASMTEIRQKQWAQKTGKSTTAPKLCTLPPTTEAFEQNVRRAHHQLAQWYSALDGEPPNLNAVDFGWEVDDTNKSLIPRNLADGVPYAPDNILKLVRCGCSSDQPCRGGNCGCMGRQLVCTMFCACGGGSACCNPFNIDQHTTDVHDDTDDYELHHTGEENNE